MNTFKPTPTNLAPLANTRSLFGVIRTPAPAAGQLAEFPSNPQSPPEPAQPIPNQQNKPAENPPETSGNPAENPKEPAENSNANPRPPHAPKRGPVGFLFTLPMETQEEILEMLERNPRRMVTRHLAPPEPDGLGVEISEDSLKRFLTHHKLRRQQEHHAQLTTQARELLNGAKPDSEDDVTHAALRLIKTQLLEHTIQENTLEQLSKLHLILNRIRLTDLAERRLAQRHQNRTGEQT